MAPMPQGQLLLFPDPRPLVDRLGAGFFRSLPESPGVYLMRNDDGLTLYVGKALNLRRRLGSYRVANPDRVPPRLLRLLRAVTRIDIEECLDEQAALATEARLLQSLRPKFNRAGTWPRVPRLVGWRMNNAVLELATLDQSADGWRALGPLPGAWRLRDALARLAWRAVNPRRSLAELPHGWTRGPAAIVRRIPCGLDPGPALRLFDALSQPQAPSAWESLLEPSAARFDAALAAEDWRLARSMLRLV